MQIVCGTVSRLGNAGFPLCIFGRILISGQNILFHRHLSLFFQYLITNKCFKSVLFHV